MLRNSTWQHTLRPCTGMVSERQNDIQPMLSAIVSSSDDAIIGTRPRRIASLRTPLNAIAGYARLRQVGLVNPDEQRKAIDTIVRNASSLTQMIEDVLDVSRIVSGRVR